jgi:arylsulfatase A-like enzyme
MKASTLFLAIACIGLAGAAIPGAWAAERPPNIVFCFGDDWGRYAGIYDAVDGGKSLNGVVKTPNIDRVAKAGVVFRHAFVPAPSCTPCRSSLLSGQYFWRTGRGAILQGAVWDDSIPSFPLLLGSRAGWHVGKSGKVWSPGRPADAPYGGQKHAWEKAGRSHDNFGENVAKLVRDGVPLEEAKRQVLAPVGGNFRAFLAAKKPGQPFCYWFGCTTTHRSYQKGAGQAHWGINPDALKGRMPKFLPDVPEVRADVADYLGEVQAWDAAVGEMLKALEESGEASNTIVVISGDHGMPGVPGGKCNLYDFGVRVALIARGPEIPGGRVVDDFVNLMDLAPTCLEAAGQKPPDVMTGRSFLNVLRSDKSGQVDPARTWVITGRERHVAAAREGNLPYPQRALRTGDFLYIRNFHPERWPMGEPKFDSAAPPSEDTLAQNTFAAFADMDASPTKAWLVAHRSDPEWKWHYDYAFSKRPEEELYDIKADPQQVKNLSGDPAFRKPLEEMKQRLMAELSRTGDPRAAAGECRFEAPPFAGPQSSD